MKKGFILPALISVILVFLIMVPTILRWVTTDTKHSVREERKSRALYLAEAAVERGYWKVKSSTSTFESVMKGNILSGYNFDKVYTDIMGGSYRIRITSGSAKEVVIIGEGRDYSTNEIRAIKAIYRNQTINGAMLSGSRINPSGSTTIHWGPILSWGDINLSAGAENVYFPRKFSKQLVRPRDNSLNPPNTDGVEWWSAYDVPELPIFDFATIRSSAASNGTLNCGGYTNSYPATPNSSNNWTMTCNCNYTNSSKRCCANRDKCYIENIYADRRYNQGLLWYWDEGKSVYITHSGVKGSFFVRGDLRIDGDDCYGPWYKTNGYDPYGGYHLCGGGPSSENGPGALFVDVPKQAYIEYAKIDTPATNQYPGDLGLSSSSLVYQIGACNKTYYYQCGHSCEQGCERGASGDDIGLYGFLYVGGNLQIYGAFDIYGAIWVVGDVNTGAGNNVSVFFNENLELPTLNVILIRESWQEITPSNLAWV
ncbi:MAG: hypothetical protein ACP5IO_02620 [Elusimicrobiales bacterium]